MAKKNDSKRSEQPTLDFPRLVAGISIKSTRADGTNVGISTYMEFTRSLTTKEVKMLWDAEHLLNALPTNSRVHITLSESK